MRKLVWLGLMCALLMAPMASCSSGGQAADSTADPDTGGSAFGTETTFEDPMTDPATETERPETVTGEAVTEETTVEETTSDETVPADPEMRVGQEVKVVSFNLDANESTIGTRARPLTDVILSYEPDSFGVQECRGSWVGQLNRVMRGKYNRIGVDAGGNKDATGGYFATYIFYRADKFKEVDSGTFWLSRTPEVPSKYSSTVDCNRTCTWAILEDIHTGFRYVHMNCHLDWMDTSVTAAQMQMIRGQVERFEAMGYPVFATGDYNTDEQTDVYKLMLNDRVADAKYVADKTMNLGTYPDYGKYDVTKEKPIDFCFVSSGNMHVLEYKVMDEKPRGKYVSDHHGIFVHARVEALPDQDRISSVPAFSEGDTVTYEASENRVQILFPQAKDASGAEARFYRIAVVDANGKEINRDKISSGVFLFDTPEVVSHAVFGMKDGTYTVSIQPIGLRGEEGETLNALLEVKRPEMETESVALEKFEAAPDILDVRVENGQAVDKSANGHAVEQVGAVKLDGGMMDFRGADYQGNLMVDGIREHYTALQKGFTLETVITTGDDLTTYQSIISNMHAGGFGLELENGFIRMALHLNGTYVGASAPVNAHETYHIAAVYDTKQVVIYVNGRKVEAVDVSGTLGIPTEESAKYLCIGADSEIQRKGEYPFDGAVGFVRFYTATANEGQSAWLFSQYSK